MQTDGHRRIEVRSMIQVCSTITRSPCLSRVKRRDDSPVHTTFVVKWFRNSSSASIPVARDPRPYVVEIVLYMYNPQGHRSRIKHA